MSRLRPLRTLALIRERWAGDQRYITRCSECLRWAEDRTERWDDAAANLSQQGWSRDDDGYVLCPDCVADRPHDVTDKDIVAHEWQGAVTFGVDCDRCAGSARIGVTYDMNRRNAAFWLTHKGWRKRRSGILCPKCSGTATQN